jgi:hypothetical protein
MNGPTSITAEPRSSRRKEALICLSLYLALIALAGAAQPAGTPSRWWKGNLHTHSLWSDGDDFPEIIADWYKQRGYHFLALSDHNVVLEGEKWIETTNKRVAAALERYLDRFGAEWVERREESGKQQLRLKTLTEFRGLFEEPGRFLLIPAEEITDRHLTAPVHINATNLRELIAPQGGSNVLEVMQNNVNAVLEQRRRTGQPMVPHLNHPNFGWGVTAEELMRVRGERFFEVYNGHPQVRNEGDAIHAGTERMWDIILTWRLAVLNLEPIYGLAVDDAHNYGVFAPTNSNPGRGWVMARAPRLAPEAIMAALEAGDFYASTGVTLKNVRRGPKHYEIEIVPEVGVTYTTRFIGTRKHFDRTNEPIRTAGGEALRVTHRYSAEIGELLAEVKGVRPGYKLNGDEIYVRATVISSKVKDNPYSEGEVEKAWTQPLIPGEPPRHF